MGMNRKARRAQKKQSQTAGRPQSFYDNVKDGDGDGDVPLAKRAEDIPKAKSKLEQEEKGERLESAVGGTGESVTSGANVAEAAVDKFNARPEVSQVIVDEDTGIERIQQGKAVMDVVTRKAVKLSDSGADARLAQMFPGVPDDVRATHRLDWTTVEIPEVVQKLKEACLVDGALPPHPSVSNKGIDFVLANRDKLGSKMKKTLGRLKLKAQSNTEVEEAREMRKLWKHYMTLEDHISAPFRQILLDAEGKVGPNFGNLDLKSYCAGDAYQRAGAYLVLKGMVAHWEKKVRDAEFVENTPSNKNNFLQILATGDPKRYLPDPPIIFRLNECTRICLMAQKMTATLVNDPELFDDLPTEIRFVEKALSIKGGTALRQYAIEEFCPAEGITFTALREGMRRLSAQMECMQLDPYGDITNTLLRLSDALAVGSEDERDAFVDYVANTSKNSPGWFQTYTFDHEVNSLVRFLDNTKKIEDGTAGPIEDVSRQLGNEARGLFGFEAKSSFEKEDGSYSVPKKRAMNRPHMVGWLDLLGDEEMTGGLSKKDGEETFESDNWKPVED